MSEAAPASTSEVENVHVAKANGLFGKAPAPEAPKSAAAAPELEPGDADTAAEALIAERAAAAKAAGVVTDADVIGIHGAEDFAKQMDASMNGDKAAEAAPEAAAKPAEDAKPAAKVAQADVDPPAPVQRKWRLGGREFDSPEALEAYASGLEASRAELAAQFAVQQEALKPKEPEVDPADIIFEDPKKAVALIEARVEAKLAAQTEAQARAREAARNERETWDAFYGEHPELKGFERHVQALLPELVKEHRWDAQTPFGTWAKTLGERANSELDKLVEKRRPGAALPAAKGRAAQGDPAEFTRPAPEPVVEDFTKQLSAMRKKGKLVHG